MIVLRARNAHEALPLGLELLMDSRPEETRNGRVRVADTPVTTVFNRPTERVVLWPWRDANPFFHLMEGLWMLVGRDDVDLPATYVKRMRSFSDDGKTLHGAYGHRWRRHFGRDQIEAAVEEFASVPGTRRVVLAMWDPATDLGRRGLDLPCNTHIYFRVNKDLLDMTVCCRSNDAIWGAYGANVVHFSMLQEYMAARLGLEVGTYWQVSNNFHAYESEMERLGVPPIVLNSNPYDGMKPMPMISVEPAVWLREVQILLDEGPVIGVTDPFLRRVVVPLMVAHKAWREMEGEERFAAAREALGNCQGPDWSLAAREWIDRREQRWREAQG